MSTKTWRQMVERRHNPRILNLGSKWWWLISFAPRPLYYQESRLWFPSYKCAESAQGRSGRYGEENDHLSLQGIEPKFFGFSAQILIAIPTERRYVVMNYCMSTCVMSHLIGLRVRYSGTVVGTCYRMVYGKFPCSLAGGRLDSVGVIFCLVLCYCIKYTPSTLWARVCHR
jgi:hypothetical protein